MTVRRTTMASRPKAGQLWMHPLWHTYSSGPFTADYVLFVTAGLSVPGDWQSLAARDVKLHDMRLSEGAPLRCATYHVQAAMAVSTLYSVCLAEWPGVSPFNISKQTFDLGTKGDDQTSLVQRSCGSKAYRSR
nr:hypothetical protein CFP56_38869 [Quercus suber]